MEKKEDRRIQRTRTMLSEALIDLIIEKGYAAVTIQDIIDRANVGRSTFYTHFQDKEQLLVGNLTGLLKFIKDQIESNSENALPDEFRFDFSLAMLQHIHGHKRLYKAVANKQSGIIVMHHLQRLLSGLVLDEVDKLSPSTDSSIPQEINVEFIVNTFFTLVSWWIDQSKLGPADEIDRLFHRLTLSGLRHHI
jgi:AcrR family transcriptional regulator